MNRFATIATLAALAVSATAIPAQADTHSVEVRTSDLNLSTVDGRKALQTRIRSAAKSACGGQPDARDTNANLAFARCFSAAITSGNAQIAARTAPVLASR